MFSWIWILLSGLLSVFLSDGCYQPFGFFSWLWKYLLPDEDIFQHLLRAGILRTARTFFNVQHIRNFLVRISLYCIQVENSSVTHRQYPDTFYYLFGLNDRRNTFLPHLDAVRMHNIQALVEPLVLLEVVD